ncbi:hypothetical protein [Azohydromonas aeria]|uniref:hypothetical protein n=1 Tax=Azohydromonas aeria TaxID=2590212 RepID=UPI0012F9A68F|nr:hypothetical protein [Azohydromonas aeria]
MTATGEAFTVNLGPLVAPMPYRASAPVPLREGERAVSSEILPRKTKVRGYDQKTYDLPATVWAWRVSAIRSADGRVYSRLEAMTQDYGRTPAGEVVGYFTELRGHAADAVARIAPGVNAAAVRAYRAALAQADAPAALF